jgi:uncharacterized delta-60 repeat protein
VKFNTAGAFIYGQATNFPLTLTNLITGSSAISNIATTNLKYIENTHKFIISGTVNNCFSVYQFDDLQNGNLDPNFANGNQTCVTTSVTSSSSILVKLPNGTIFTGGSSDNTSNFSMNFSQLDSNGIVIHSNSNAHFVLTNDQFSNVIELNDGKLLAVNNPTGFVKYNTNGTKDLSYGINGTIATSINKVKKQLDGKILFSTSQNLNRLNTDGTIETYVDPLDGLTYNWHYDLSYALTTLPINVVDPNIVNNQFQIFIDSFEIDSNGKIYITFGLQLSGNPINIFYLVRLNPDFSFDTSFGNSGFTSFNFPNPSGYGFPTDLIIQNNGKIIVMGNLDKDSTAINKFGICRFNTNGILDSSFNSTGYIIFPQLANNYWPYKIIKLSDDSFIINERKYVTNHYEYDLIKFNSNGVLDTSFGTNGILVDDINQINESPDFIVLPNNNIIKGGSSSNSDYTFQFKTVCYNSNGILNTAYGTNGYLTTNINNFSDINNIQLLQNGNLLASGYSSTITNYLATMVQYNLNSMGNEQFANTKNIIVYPNPAKSQLSIDNTIEKFENLTIYNSLGIEVLSTKLNSTYQDIDVSVLSSGIYILNFKKENIFKSVKIIKE